MAGVLPHYKTGPATYNAASLIIGGQLVVPNGAAPDPTIKTCPTGQQVNVLGVAATDAVNTAPEGTASFPGTWPGDGLANQDQLLDISIFRPEVAVYNNVDIPVNYDGTAVVFGGLLQTSTTVAGAVMAWSGTNAQAIIGRCTQPGGVPAVAGTYRAFIRV